MTKDEYKTLRLEQIADQESFFFNEAEADLLLEREWMAMEKDEKLKKLCILEIQIWRYYKYIH